MTKPSLHIVDHRTIHRTIRETEAIQRRRQIKYFWLWVINNRLIVLAFVVASLAVTLNFGQMLINVGNGLVFLVAMAGLLGLLSGLIQFGRLDHGYEIQDWLPRIFYGKAGWQ